MRSPAAASFSQPSPASPCSERCLSPASLPPTPPRGRHLLHAALSVCWMKPRVWAASLSSSLCSTSSPRAHIQPFVCPLPQTHYQPLGNALLNKSLPPTPHVHLCPARCARGGPGTEQVRTESPHALAISLGSSNSRSLGFLPHPLLCDCEEINICKYPFPAVVLALNSVD